MTARRCRRPLVGASLGTALLAACAAGPEAGRSLPSGASSSVVPTTAPRTEPADPAELAGSVPPVRSAAPVELVESVGASGPSPAPESSAPVADDPVQEPESPMTDRTEPPADTAGDPANDASDGRPERDGADEPPMAMVTSFAVTAEGVRFGVVSNGCTTRESLAHRIERLDAETVALTLLRVRPDGCRRMPMTKRFELGRDELGIEDEDVVLRNPLSRLPGRSGR